MLSLNLSLDNETTCFDVLLSVVPRASRIGSTDGDLDATDDVAGKQTADTSGSEQEAHCER